MLDYGYRQRRSLGRVRACAELIEENQRAVVTFRYYVNYIAHVRRESRQALLYALLVAYVSQYMREHGHPAAVVSRNVQSALVHRREQTYRLYRHRLSAGVWPGDDQRVEAVAELNVDRHCLALVEQRMPRVAQHYSLAVHRCLLAVELIREFGLGKYKIQTYQHLKVGVYIVAVFGAVGRELGEYTLYLRLFPGRELTQLVVRLDGPHRLDKQRRAG